MAGFIPTFQRQRSPRIESKPDRFNCTVLYQTAASSEPLVAQFGDISGTGIRLISRHLANTKVSELLRLQFTLPGTTKELNLQGRVVRRINDFTFAVRFAGLDNNEKRELERAIAQYVEYAKPSAWRDFHTNFIEWMQLHRIGVAISVTGAILAAVIFSMIYMNSDEHHGREIRSWGDYPKNWSKDYWSKDSYGASSNSSSAAGASDSNAKRPDPKPGD